jgi:hypothetical protein
MLQDVLRPLDSVRSGDHEKKRHVCKEDPRGPSDGGIVGFVD